MTAHAEHRHLHPHPGRPDLEDQPFDHYQLMAEAIGELLVAKGVFGAEQLRRTILLGEVGLDGRLRPVRGILPATLAAQQAGFPPVIVPLRQAGEAKLVEGIEVFGIASITQLVAFLRGVPMRRDALEVSAVHSLAGFC